jgi:hypothetical protein
MQQTNAHRQIGKMRIDLTVDDDCACIAVEISPREIQFECDQRRNAALEQRRFRRALRERRNTWTYASGLISRLIGSAIFC